jgi:hypothetical protein
VASGAASQDSAGSEPVEEETRCTHQAVEAAFTAEPERWDRHMLYVCREATDKRTVGTDDRHAPSAVAGDPDQVEHDPLCPGHLAGVGDEHESVGVRTYLGHRTTFA